MTLGGARRTFDVNHMASLSVRRGLFLSVLVPAFGAAILAASVALILNQGLGTSVGYRPSWFTIYVVALLVVRLGALFAIWNLRRLGVYSLLALEIVEVSMGVSVLASGLTYLQRLAAAVPAFLVLFVLWYIPLRARWHSFT